MDWLDKAIAAVSPETALRRAQARERLKAYRLATDASLRRMVTDKGGGNAITERSAVKLRDWGRHLARNNPTVQAIVREAALRTSHFQRVPMVMLANGLPAEDINMHLAAESKRYADKLHVSGVTGYRQMRQVAGQSYIRDGEVFLQTILGSKRYSYPTDLPLAVNVLESDFLPMHSGWQDPDIIQGVEITPAGRVVRYHFYKTHPGESIPGRVGWRPETIAVPVAQVMSLVHRERAGQLRGISMLAPSGETAADLDEYLESERIAVKFAASIGLQIVRAPDMATPVLNTDGQRQIDFEPGMVLDQLQPGERAEMLSLNRPGDQFAEYLKQGYRGMAAGVGVNYSAVTNDFDGSYSSQRQMLVTAQGWYEYQQQIQIVQVESRLHEAFLQALTLAGRMPKLRGVNLDTLLDADYIAPPMPWIDPQREAAADAISVQNGFESRQGIIRKRGGSISRINDELANDDHQTDTSTSADQVSSQR